MFPKVFVQASDINNDTDAFLFY